MPFQCPGDLETGPSQKDGGLGLGMSFLYQPPSSFMVLLAHSHSVFSVSAAKYLRPYLAHVSRGREVQDPDFGQW